MLGHHPKLTHRLKKEGARADAQVLEAKMGHVTNTGPSGRAGTVTTNWNVKLRVQPNGEAPFDVEIDALFGQFENPSVGQIIAVLYDPKDHSKVVVDDSDDGSGGGAAYSPDAIVKQLQAQGFEVDGGQFTAVKPGSEMVINLGGGAGDDAVASAGAGAGAGVAAGADPVELLTQLDTLHRSGVLSDAEFEAQKQRILAKGS